MPIVDRINSLSQEKQDLVIQWLQANDGCSVEAANAYIDSIE